jgi:hypothetical protein
MAITPEQQRVAEEFNLEVTLQKPVQSRDKKNEGQLVHNPIIQEDTHMATETEKHHSRKNNDSVLSVEDADRLASATDPVPNLVALSIEARDAARAAQDEVQAFRAEFRKAEQLRSQQLKGVGVAAAGVAVVYLGYKGVQAYRNRNVEAE